MDPPLDRSTTFCLVKAVNEPGKTAFQLQHNLEYRVSLPQPIVRRGRTTGRDQTPSFQYEENNSMLALTTDSSKIFDPALGHVFGSDDEMCDVLLDTTNRFGVSRQHFRIYMNVNSEDPEHLILKNMSRLGTRVHGIPIFGDVEISTDGLLVDAGPVSLHIRFPQLTSAFLVNWRKFRQEVQEALPTTVKTNISSIDPTPEIPRKHVDSRQKRPYGQTTTSCLGSGNFGAVSKVERGSDGAVFAIKRTKSSSSPSELSIMQKLSHQHTIQYIDFYRAQDFLYIVMEYCGFGDLEQFLQDNQCFEEPEAKDFSQQVLSALAYLHVQGIVHRDVKPSNILLASNLPRTYKVTDFGLSRDISKSLANLSIVGTHLYAAPEIYPGSDRSWPEYDYHIDIWSFGAILWLALTGCYTIELTNDDCKDLQKLKRIKEQWQPDTMLLEDVQVSKEGQCFVLETLETAPDQRPSAKDCLSHRWLRSVDLEPSPIRSWYTQRQNTAVEGMLQEQRSQQIPEN